MNEQFEQQDRQYITGVFYGTWMWLEVFFISLSAAALGFAFRPDDPLWISGQFPWTWLAAILIALRYGVVPGIGSSLLLLAAWEIFERNGVHLFPKEYFIGGVLLVMLCGQFNIIWETRLMRAKQINSYIKQRLSQLTNQHHLLLLSHQNLEQEFFAKPISLRDAIIRVNVMLNETQESETSEQALLKLLTQYCQLESAAIFVPNKQGYTKSCEVGRPTDLRADDPLLQHALKEKALSHLTIQSLDDKDANLSPFLIISPLYFSRGELMAVFAVERLPFFALTTETLQIIEVILEYYADSRGTSNASSKMREVFEDMPGDFAQQFISMLNLQKKFGIKSHIVIISLSGDETSKLAAARLNSVRRALDVSWIVTKNKGIQIANLMPLDDEKAVERYFVRIEAWFNEYFADQRFTLRVISLAKNDPITELKHLLEEGTNA